MVSLNSFILGLVGLIILIYIASAIAKRLNLVDIPDETRKKYHGPVPLIGGLALFISIIYGAIVFGVETFYLYLIISLVPIIFVGTLDGIRTINIPPGIRLIGQILSSWLVILLTGIYIENLGDLIGFGDFILGKLGIPFTIFAIVGL